ncbi:hypothetical protein B0H16DRAFT_1453327 [Mycena metata]|uniref:Uncharacterized protein n=1 Tax=Mycena metata TaxID=1033252 RepID=A0AAD7JLX1_9AGAR|nr:hypothetical protein B0H16DRAFT_1453327 [Mycena metata]
MAEQRVYRRQTGGKLRVVIHKYNRQMPTEHNIIPGGRAYSTYWGLAGRLDGGTSGLDKKKEKRTEKEVLNIAAAKPGRDMSTGIESSGCEKLSATFRGEKKYFSGNRLKTSMSFSFGQIFLMHYVQTTPENSNLSQDFNEDD